ncbi:MAG: protoheme farnesyltransferase [bacterium]|nr:protoheme farnesyltransferase [bacterium]
MEPTTAAPTGATAPAHNARVTTVALRDLIALGKPSITMEVLVTTAAGIWLAPTPLPTARAVVTLIGVALVVAAANAFNMYLERDVDALMRRTRNRPLPAGRLAPEVALLFGLFCAVLALPLVRAAANPLTCALALASLLLYVFAYTPLKRRSTWSLVVGAVPGAIPPLMGWTASTGHLGAPGLALFGLLFVWQIPHFIAISMFRADEYARAGLKVVGVVHGLDGARWRIVAWSVVQFAASLLLLKTGVAGRFYEGAAFALGAVLLAICALGLRPMSREQTHRWARWFFLYSLVYLTVLCTALVIGRS